MKYIYDVLYFAGKNHPSISISENLVANSGLVVTGTLDFLNRQNRSVLLTFPSANWLTSLAWQIFQHHVHLIQAFISRWSQVKLLIHLISTWMSHTKTNDIFFQQCIHYPNYCFAQVLCLFGEIELDKIVRNVKKK